MSFRCSGWIIEYVLQQVKPQLGVMAPSASVTEEAFKRMGSRPEELVKALNVLRALPHGASPDEHLPTIAQSFGLQRQILNFKR